MNEIERLDQILVSLARIRWEQAKLLDLRYRPADALIGRKEAARIAQKDEKTIRRWVAKYGIGFRTPGGQWQVKRDEFLKFLSVRLTENS